MMLKWITTLCVLFVLQVFSEEAKELDCASLCEQVDSGYAGICCGIQLSKRELSKDFLNIDRS